MYFINIKGLKQDIIEKKLTESDRFTYIIIYLLLDTFAIEITPYFPNNEIPTIFDYAYTFMAIISIFLGAYFIFQANGGEKGEDFAGKFFSLTWVRSIQFLLIFIPFYFLFIALNEFVLHLSNLNYKIVDFFIYSGFLFAIYLYAYRDVLEIREQE